MRPSASLPVTPVRNTWPPETMAGDIFALGRGAELRREDGADRHRSDLHRDR
jgi:hypothetical protein